MTAATVDGCDCDTWVADLQAFLLHAISSLVDILAALA